MDHPELPAVATVQAGLDLEEAWRSFLPFEALHHLHDICNPIGPEDLEAVITALAPVAGDRVLDLACGHGELLLRLAERTDISGLGVDLSPWAIRRAVERSRGRPLRGTVEWRVGDALAESDPDRWDIVVSLGAAWLWGGFAETAAALSSLTKPGGRLAIGDLRLRSEADRAELAEAGSPTAAADTGPEQKDVLRGYGLSPLREVIAAEGAYWSYLRLAAAAAEAYAAVHPEHDYRAVADLWLEEFRQEQRHLRWTVWVVRKESARS